MAKQEAPALKSYKTKNRNHHHNGKVVPKGTVIQMEEKDAKPLIEINAIAPVEEKAAE